MIHLATDRWYTLRIKMIYPSGPFDWHPAFVILVEGVYDSLRVLVFTTFSPVSMDTAQYTKEPTQSCKKTKAFLKS